MGRNNQGRTTIIISRSRKIHKQETAGNFTRWAGSQIRFFVTSGENVKCSHQTKPKISEGSGEKQSEEFRLEQV